jgi:hypothetical protein
MAVRIESAGQPGPMATAKPLTDDSLAARLLPAAIALRSRIGRGSDGWSRPIGPNLAIRWSANIRPPSKHGASTGKKSAQTGRIKMTWNGKTPGQYGCAARDSNPNPRIKSPLLRDSIPAFYQRLYASTLARYPQTSGVEYRLLTSDTA